MKTFAFVLAFLAASSYAQDDECEPINGVCDINLNTIVEVSFYDVLDGFGCQLECEGLSTCLYYTEYAPDPFDEDLKKCMLFESCNIITECDDCTTYPSDPDDCFTTGESCKPTEDNVVDIFYFSATDFFNCEQKCKDISDCNYWSQFTIETFGSSTNKCFLFRECDETEPCIECVTGEVTD